MTKYSYTVKTGSLKKFLEKIPSIGIPEKITTRFMYSLGFKSTNDRKVIPILKSIKFIDVSGSPTEYYKIYRDKSKSKRILGKAIKEFYSEVFKMYPNANEEESNNLKNFFSTNTGLGEKATKAIVDTFKTLCGMADFDESSYEELEEDSPKELKQTLSKIQNHHNINLSLSEGREASIIIPKDITKEEVKKIEDLLKIFSS